VDAIKVPSLPKI